eukprot:TRINITY_DN9670_c6_g1_i1.p1 TRINITY_DN9670_c6_g1~~TRINITY_DN9670_c6_g1_i1.p1  ORF type:complete len:602 (+),score=154.43 TRINITY_DN9670_c6_g1_i1:69-1874(+)
MLEVERGKRVRVRDGHKFDSFRAGMVGEVVENKTEKRVMLVLFDNNLDSGAPTSVGYKYLELADPAEAGGGGGLSPKAKARTLPPLSSKSQPQDDATEKSQSRSPVPGSPRSVQKARTDSPLGTLTPVPPAYERERPPRPGADAAAGRVGDCDSGAMAEQQLQSQIRKRDERIAALERSLSSLQAEVQEAQQERRYAEEQQARLKKELEEASEKIDTFRETNKNLKTEVQQKNFEIQKVYTHQEKEMNDCEEFLRQLAASSGESLLDRRFDLDTVEVLGQGAYGYVFTATSKLEGSFGTKVVVKVQSARWAGVAMKEWAHGSEVGVHPHIVEYMETLMHKEDDRRIVQQCLQNAFDTGVLKAAKRPKRYPDIYFCLAIEYMDRGTLQHIVDKDLVSTAGIGAVAQQIASALDYMHGKKRTHNDIKPENILLRLSPNGDHLLAKLADFGLAEHSVNRTRDMDMFAYSIWCVGLKRPFTKVPSAEEREAAVVEFEDRAPTAREDTQIWQALAASLRGLWGASLDMRTVMDMPSLQDLQLALPEATHAADLEDASKENLAKRCTLIEDQWKKDRAFRRSMTGGSGLLVDLNSLAGITSDSDEGG